MGPFLGDVLPGTNVQFMWDTAGASGASITRATNGTISVYKDNSTTQSVTGVTDTEDSDTLVGIHYCAIDTASDAAFYTLGSSFNVVLSAATIDGVTVNSVLASFSIGRDLAKLGAIDAGLVQAYTDSTHVRLRSALSIADDLPNGATVFFYFGTGANQMRPLSDWVSSTDTAVFATGDALTTPVSTDTRYIVFATPPNSALATALTRIGELHAILASAGIIAGAALVNVPAPADGSVIGTWDSGSTTSGVDAARIGAGANLYIHWEMQLTSGQVGRRVKIRTFDTATGAFTWDEVLSTAITTQTYKLIPAAVSVLSPGTHTSSVVPGVADLQTRVPAALGANGNMKSDHRDTLGVAMIGTGFPGNNWRPTGASPT